jgi:polyphosphate kinase
MNSKKAGPLPAIAAPDRPLRSPRARRRSARVLDKATPLVPVRALEPLSREQGILAFNERVLSMAENEQAPLLERLRYLTIVSGNLDEFFEIRVAELQELARVDNERVDTASAAAAREQLDAIAVRAGLLIAHQYHILLNVLTPALKAEGIVILLSNDWNQAQREWAERRFVEEIEPLLTPIALDPAHPFPRISNKTLNFAVELDGRDAFGRRPGIAIVQAPRVLPRVVAVPSEIAGAPHGVMLLTSIVQGFIERLFPGLEVKSRSQFRLTRNSELFVDEEEVTNLRQALRSELGQRHYGDGVRLELSADMSPEVVELLKKEFELSDIDCYFVEGSVNLVRLAQIIDMVDRPDLKFPRFDPALPPAFRKKDLFQAIAKTDVLVHQPYESFNPVMDFLRSAATDPQVVAIKQTIYRTGADSLLMEALIEAAQAGKEVTVVLELMARFDEEANINWAAKLEEVGAHVVYGVVGHKTHAKLALIIRREHGRLRRYAHLGTGNYHQRTARLYEDFGLFTAEEKICADVHEVFRRLTGLGTAGKLHALLQAPFTLHDYVVKAIRRETEAARAGKKAYIAAKMNALLEQSVIDALYEASQAGVKIALIVRGVCALRPGIEGLSHNIRVVSLIGRFLEHSRIFYFWAGGDEDVWLGSADWMDRNFFRRVEVAFPVRDRKLKQRVLAEGLRIYLEPGMSVWEMDAAGGYKLCGPAFSPERDPQQILLRKLAGA